VDKLKSMTAFAQVVAEGSFAACARSLAVSPALVTRLISELEEHLGVRLLQRTTRKLVLTPAGEVYLDRVRGLLAELDAVEDMTRSHATAMSGNIRVAALPGIVTHLIVPAASTFRDLHPQVRFELRSDPLAARGIEANDMTLLTDQVDMSSEAVVRRVVSGTSILCAAPEYLARHGMPGSAQDLVEHQLVRLSLPDVAPDRLTLIDETNPSRNERVALSPVLVCNDHEAVLGATLAGAGISSQALQVVAPMLHDGRLQRVLAPWISERFTLVAAFSSRRHLPMRVRAFLDHLIRYSEQLQPTGAA